MKGALEVVCHDDGYVFSYSGNRYREVRRGGAPDPVEELNGFREKHGLVGHTVYLFLAEALLFGLELDLPLRTPDLKEAVGLQLGPSLPFPPEEALSAYSVVRGAEGYRVMAFAARARAVVPALEELIAAGYIVKGIYPEHQRYLTKRTGGQEWALVMPGRPTRVYVFGAGGQLKTRLLLPGAVPALAELSERCGTELIYHPDPASASGFRPAEELLSEPPLLKEYNLLPRTYLRPDYLKLAIVALLVLNLLALAGGIGLRFWQISGLAAKTETEISQMQPKVREVEKTRTQVDRAEKFLAGLTALGGNPDLTTFIQKLTAALPEDSYLDRFVFDSRQQTVTISGYSDNLAEMTKSLQGLGEVRLKSTSRRRNRNYFLVEIGLP